MHTLVLSVAGRTIKVSQDVVEVLSGRCFDVH